MARPVTEKVHFNLNVQYLERNGKWIAVTTETGIIAVGESQQAATDEVVRMNVLVVERAKANGRRDLRKWLTNRGIRYQLDSDNVPSGIEALLNVPLTSVVNKSGNVPVAA